MDTIGPIDTYDIYAQWCFEHNRVPPSREWWDKACGQRRTTLPIEDVAWDIENERREGWANDAV
jgi:hypothetical protein